MRLRFSKWIICIVLWFCAQSWHGLLRKVAAGTDWSRALYMLVGFYIRILQYCAIARMQASTILLFFTLALYNNNATLKAVLKLYLVRSLFAPSFKV
jgi:hypothetical protein